LSKKSDITLLIPGAQGWDVWQGNANLGFHRELENGALLASQLENIPSGRLIMAFPVREALAIPFKVPTQDEALFEDLATMHLEKIGIRPELGAGRLTDVFLSGLTQKTRRTRDEDDGTEEASLLSVVLAAPSPDAMPPRAPSGFDISARFFTLPENAVTLWQELGRWVFAITTGKQLTYFQSLSGKTLGADAARDIQLAVTQLSLQGVETQPERAIIWTTGNDLDPRAEEIEQLGSHLGMDTSAEPKPRPTLPDPLSRLVPADISAQQKQKARRKKRSLVIASILLLTLGAAAYFAYDYFSLTQKLKEQKIALEQTRLKHSKIGLFNADWEQLAPLVDSQHWPLILLSRCDAAIPSSQKNNLRFKVFEATREHITIRGEANNIKLASSYAAQLRRALPDYKWTLPPATSDTKTDRWKFTYEGNLKGETK